MSDAGVKAGMVVTAPEYLVMGGAVAADAGAAEVGNNIVTGVQNFNNEAITPLAQQVGAATETYFPGGAQGATDFGRGFLSPLNLPPSVVGLVYATVRNLWNLIPK